MKENAPSSTSSSSLDGDNTVRGLSYPPPGTEVFTACGGIVRYMSDTPSVVYKDEVIYFCLPICKVDYEDNPKTSCLAARFISEKGG